MEDNPGLIVFRSRVLPEWIDYNDHMNIAFYVTAFSKAVDALLDLIGMDAEYRTAKNRSAFTTEAHICYLRELREGESFNIALELLGHDDKRLHVLFLMYKDGDKELAATSEQMFLHVDTKFRKVTSFDPTIQEQILRLWVAYPTAEMSKWVGRSIMKLTNSRR